MNGRHPLYREACESLARFAGPLVIEKADFGGARDILIAGWNPGVYEGAISRRWPQLRVKSVNPFANGNREIPDDVMPRSFDVVLLAGLLASVRPGRSAADAGNGGAAHPERRPAVSARFLPAIERRARPEIMLGALGRHAARGGCRNWRFDRLRDTLEQLGLDCIRSESLPAGSMFVSARKL